MTTSRPLLLTSSALAAATVLLQIAYPLAPDRQLGRLSAATVLVACGACLTHAVAMSGPTWTAAFTVAVLAGAFVVEAVGVATGFPFGHYSYAHSLGPLVLGVPLLVPLAWLMMAYPSLLLGVELAAKVAARQWVSLSVAVTATLAGLTMAAWDVFLDPQMVAAGHWTWQNPTPGLPGITGIPLTNLAGWAVTAIPLMAFTAAVLRRLPAPPAARSGLRSRLPVVTPVTLLAWTWAGGVVSNAVFFDRPAVAVWGGILLGALVLPYLMAVRERWSA